jgi:hypothetical protein
MPGMSMSIAARALSLDAKTISHENPDARYIDECFTRSFRPMSISLR